MSDSSAETDLGEDYIRPVRASRDLPRSTVAVDIPGAPSHFEPRWFVEQSEASASLLNDDDDDSPSPSPTVEVGTVTDGLVFGSLPTYLSSLGTPSQGHGLGHMMRGSSSRRWGSRQNNVQNTIERTTTLPSHDELSELAAEATEQEQQTATAAANALPPANTRYSDPLPLLQRTLLPPVNASVSAQNATDVEQQQQQQQTLVSPSAATATASKQQQHGWTEHTDDKAWGPVSLGMEDNLLAPRALRRAPAAEAIVRHHTDTGGNSSGSGGNTTSGGGAPVFQKSPTGDAIVFGVINAVAGIPALVAFAAIVFKHPSFGPYLDLLCKFFFISSAVHQTVFNLLSTLPFAVGQVQDVGLIFLSAMGTSIAELTEEAGRGVEVALGTSLLTMTISTFVVGLGTLLVARRHLAEFVQFIPLPVIGGYLGFVGYFCLASGVALGCSVQIDSISSWVHLLSHDALLKLLPTVASTVCMVLALERIKHPLGLPMVLVCLVFLFHTVLWVAGVPLSAAEAAGWVLTPSKNKEPFWNLWKLYNIRDLSFSGIYWGAAVRQIAKTAGLLLVVVFGSCMDIAAIQQDTPQKIDFDRELTTVAVSNIATGAIGIGFTGSYIFSQTIFTMRAGVFNKANGWVVAALEAAIFLYPYSVVQYLPNYFLGALLVWFGVEISRDWLIYSYFKLTAVEYGLLWLTFAAILQWGLEGGIAVGIISATLYFAYAYALSQQQGFGTIRARSVVVRTVDQQAVLDAFLPTHVLTAALQGFVFFGSAQSLGRKLQEAASNMAQRALRHHPHDGGDDNIDIDIDAAVEQCLQTLGEDYSGPKHALAKEALASAPMFLVLDFSGVTGFDATGARTIAVVLRDLGQLGVAAALTACEHHGIATLLEAHGVALTPMRWPPKLLASPSSLMASALSFAQDLDLASQAVDTLTTPLLVSSPLGRRYSGTFSYNNTTTSGGDGGGGGLGGDGQGGNEINNTTTSNNDDRHHAEHHEEEPEVHALMFPSLEEGLRYCEDAFIGIAIRYQLCKPYTAGVSLEELILQHVSQIPLISINQVDGIANILKRYLDRYLARRGELLWKCGDPATEVILIEKGRIRVDQYDQYDITSTTTTTGGNESQQQQQQQAVSGGSGGNIIRTFELGAGCVLGSTDLYLTRPHSTTAMCVSHASRVWRLSRAAMERMAGEAPVALNVLQLIVMRLNSSDLSAAANAANDK